MLTAAHPLRASSPERLWMLPDGELLHAAEYERYVGLRGQVRVGLVSAMGFVHHYDLAELRIVYGSRQPIGLETLRRAWESDSDDAEPVYDLTKLRI